MTERELGVGSGGSCTPGDLPGFRRDRMGDPGPGLGAWLTPAVLLCGLRCPGRGEGAVASPRDSHPFHLPRAQLPARPVPTTPLAPHPVQPEQK